MAHKHEKHEKRVLWAIVVTQFSHLFCCVLPLLFSLASLLAGFGLIIATPGWVEGLHEFMHHLEVPIITLSAVVVVMGWALHWYSYKNDCHDHGCEHEPCGPRKRAASKVLIAASILLVMNVTIFLGFHEESAEGLVVLDSEMHVHDHKHDHGHAHAHE